MVKFEYRPFKEVIIHQISKTPVTQFIYTSAIGVEDGGVAAPLFWANGVVFRHIPIPFSEDVIKEQLKGVVHWGLLQYGYLEHFKEALEGPRRVRIPLIKTVDPLFIDLVEWIRNVYEEQNR